MTRSKTGFTRGDISIQLKDGSTWVMAADIIGDFAVHEPIDYIQGLWHITHIPTGINLRPQGTAATKNQARAIARGLAEDPGPLRDIRSRREFEGRAGIIPIVQAFIRERFEAAGIEPFQVHEYRHQA